jgi:hypothetical protein
MNLRCWRPWPTKEPSCPRKADPSWNMLDEKVLKSFVNYLTGKDHGALIWNLRLIPGYFCCRSRLIPRGAMPIEVEGGCLHGNPTIRRRSLFGGRVFPSSVANGQLCHIRKHSSDRRPGRRRGGNLAYRGGQQSSVRGKRSRLGNSDRGRDGTVPVCSLVLLASLAVSRAEPAKRFLKSSLFVPSL